MPELLWDDVKGFFDPELGYLPDLWVGGTAVEDWQALFDLVGAGEWRWEYLEGPSRSLVAAEAFPRPGHAETPMLRVWPVPGVLVIFRLLAEDRIDFDVDLREPQGQDRLDLFCGFLRAIGTCLAKPVSMATEGGGPGDVFLRFDPVADEVRLTAS